MWSRDAKRLDTPASDDMARQFFWRNPGIHIYCAFLSSRLDSPDKILPISCLENICLATNILRNAQKKAENVSISYLPNPFIRNSFEVNFLPWGLWSYTDSANLNSKSNYKEEGLNFLHIFLPSFDLQKETSFPNVSLSQQAEFHLSLKV